MKNLEPQEMAPKSFRIRADNIPVCGLQISEGLKAGFITKLLKEPSGNVSWKCLGDSKVDCQVEHEAELLRMTGGGTFRMIYPCVRCAQEVEFEVKVDFNARLLPKEKDPDQGSLDLEIEAFDDDLPAGSSDEPEAIFFANGLIDLTTMLREQLFLEFPQYPSCSCAQALNPKECDLTVFEAGQPKLPEVLEHPFAQLKNWKDQSLN